MEIISVNPGDLVIIQDAEDAGLKPRDLVELKDGHIVFIEEVEGGLVHGIVLSDSKVEELRSIGILD